MSHNELYVENLVRQKRERETFPRKAHSRALPMPKRGVSRPRSPLPFCSSLGTTPPPAGLTVITGNASSSRIYPNPSGEMVGIDCDGYGVSTPKKTYATPAADS